MADETSPEMKITINPSRASTLISNISSIHQRISAASPSSSSVRLVAVSKLKPASDILSLHRPPPESRDEHPDFRPQIHFGENYVQELVEKSRLLPKSIRWHFIGGLQSNKCVQLAREVENLWAVESVDSVKKAGYLEKGRKEMVEKSENLESSGGGGDEGKETKGEPLRVFIQVNTSGEDSKSGVSPDPPSSTKTKSDHAEANGDTKENEEDELLSLAKYIHTSCPHLKLQGLMTIGAIARSRESTPDTINEDFTCLKKARDRVVGGLKRDGIKLEEELELSMGMSEDFEAAVKMGSSEVRVGSTIFGERPAKKDAKVV